MRPRRPGWRPGPDQELMLDVALAPEDDALAAWALWRARVEIDDLDAGSYRLLPLLWQRLSALGHDAGPRLKGVYRRTWYQNQLLLGRAPRLMDGLASAGIDTILLKGAALAPFHYGALGVRPMDDIDILVPADRAREGVELLLDLGWKAEPTPLKGTGPGRLAGRLPWLAWTDAGRGRDRFTPTYFAVRHAHGFRSPEGLAVDLHWHVIQESCDTDADREFWDAAVEVDLNGAPTRILGPADQLFHVLAHAARWNPVPPVRWVADAGAVLRSAGADLDWDRVRGQAERHGFTIAVTEMLDYLAGRFDAPVPAGALGALRDRPVTARDRAAHRVRATPPGPRAGLHELRYLRRRHRALRRERGAVGELRSFPRFVAWVLGARRPADVALYGAYELARRLAGYLFPAALRNRRPS